MGLGRIVRRLCRRSRLLSAIELVGVLIVYNRREVGDRKVEINDWLVSVKLSHKLWICINSMVFMTSPRPYGFEPTISNIIF